jgi:hypothetical protein
MQSTLNRPWFLMNDRDRDVCFFSTLAVDLKRHVTVELLPDWSGERSSSFRIHGRDYGIAELGDVGFDRDRSPVQLADFHLHKFCERGLSAYSRQRNFASASLRADPLLRFLSFVKRL